MMMCTQPAVDNLFNLPDPVSRFLALPVPKIALRGDDVGMLGWDVEVIHSLLSAGLDVHLPAEGALLHGDPKVNNVVVEVATQLQDEEIETMACTAVYFSLGSDPTWVEMMELMFYAEAGLDVFVVANLSSEFSRTVIEAKMMQYPSVTIYDSHKDCVADVISTYRPLN